MKKQVIKIVNRLTGKSNSSHKEKRNEALKELKSCCDENKIAVKSLDDTKIKLI